MANQAYSRKHPGIGISALQRVDTQAARAHLGAASLIDSYISDVEWACHRHKLVGEALRGLHEAGIAHDDNQPTARPGDLAALHAVFSEFTLILCAEVDDAVGAMRSTQRGAPT